MRRGADLTKGKGVGMFGFPFLNHLTTPPRRVYFMEGEESGIFAGQAGRPENTIRREIAVVFRGAGRLVVVVSDITACRTGRVWDGYGTGGDGR